ncbi:DNA-binding bromodomain-containing protein [Actinidia rufa]|uniref:DNA-binding bromodomain-containing protein n=1 Tax=Actinidia rufa TaxID=165716 RepID=A0A7J0DK89_9ERIC|nr:DNA-binding bromodomain-containing protein [Actinidia rufa]
MGKGAAAAEMKRKKKKGRPSLLDLQKRNLKQQEDQNQNQQKKTISPNPNFNTPHRRSTRRNPNADGTSPESDANDDNDDDDERKEKKVKLVVRLPPSNHHFPLPNSQSFDSDADLNADAENHETPLKKPKISTTAHRSGDLASPDLFEKVEKGTDTPQGTRLDSGPTTPMPDKKLLVFILDRLQKKDTYGVFSEPVDPNEVLLLAMLHLYCLIRGNLMRGVILTWTNLRHGPYKSWPKGTFENLKQVNDDGEPQPKIVRRGRPPSKHLKQSFGSPPFERVGPESPSDATLATGGDNAVGSSSYNLRRGPMISRFQSSDTLFRTSHQSRNNESYDWSSDWNTEFPASVLKAEAKHAKKQFSLDENRRATYKQFHSSAFGHDTSVLTILNGDMKQLIGVGLHTEHGYARSLARFAANLGPVVWKIASRKIKSVLPTGIEFGPGWVGENEALPWPPSALPDQKSSNNSVYTGQPLGPTIPISGTNSVVHGQNSKSELAVPKSDVGGITLGSSFQAQQKHVLNCERNGFSGVSGYDLSSQMGMVRARPAMPMGGVVPRSNTSLTPPTVTNPIISEPDFPESSRNMHCENISTLGTTAPDSSHTASEMVQPWQGLSSQRRQYSLAVPPDLNVGFQAPSSPSSSFRVGSPPQQPDLALQL